MDAVDLPLYVRLEDEVYFSEHCEQMATDFCVKVLSPETPDRNATYIIRGLEENARDFIHAMIERCVGEHPVSDFTYIPRMFQSFVQKSEILDELLPEGITLQMPTHPSDRCQVVGKRCVAHLFDEVLHNIQLLVEELVCKPVAVPKDCMLTARETALCKELEEQHNVIINLPIHASCDPILIVGRFCVAEAVRELERFFEEQQRQKSVVLPLNILPKDLDLAIRIAKDNASKIEGFGVKLYIPLPGNAEDQIFLEGPCYLAEMGEVHLQRLVLNERSLSEGKKTFPVNIAPEMNCNVIGKGGENIQHIIAKYGVQVQLPKSTGSQIMVTGISDYAQAAVAELENLAKPTPAATTMRPVHFNHRELVTALGRQQQNVAYLEKEFGVTVLLPERWHQPLMVQGHLEQVEKAVLFLKRYVTDRLYR